MADSFEKQLISTISSSWNEKAESVLGCSSSLTLIALREVTGDSMPAALAVANTWSSAFVAPCADASGGILVCLFKSDEGGEIDRLAKPVADGLPKPGGRALISTVLGEVASKLSARQSEPIAFDTISYLELETDEKKLAAVVGDIAHIGTFSLTIGDDINSQALMIYAPHGSLESLASNTKAVASPPEPAETAVKEPVTAPSAPAAPATAPAPARRNGQQRRPDVGPVNIERLLDVELDVVVRFGVTNIPLRDVVRMGVGTMIELNRSVEEPVELLVNGRQLARGEVVVVDGYYGVRITEIGPPSERAASLN